MWNFKRDIYRTAGNNGVAVDLCYGTTQVVACESCDETVVLDPFDYLIITYQYRFDDFRRDLDSATGFRNTGSSIDTLNVGCGQNSQYITPSGRNINTAYLYQAGDDVGNGRGESIVVNFKNLQTDNISLHDDVRVELYAGWCIHPPQVSGDITNVSITSYSGGTMTITNNVITSNGTVIDGPFESHDIPVVAACCSAAVATKTHIGTIQYNLATKVSNITFY